MPGFDADAHVHHATLPAPAPTRGCAPGWATSGRIDSTGTLPLWEMTLLDGLEGGRVRSAVDLLVREDLIAAPSSSLNGEMSGTVDGVVLALCAGGLRELLISRGEALSERGPRAQIPVNIRPMFGGPRVFNLTITNVPGPQDRLHALGAPLVEIAPDVAVLADGIARSFDELAVGTPAAR